MSYAALTALTSLCAKKGDVWKRITQLYSEYDHVMNTIKGGRKNEVE